jgi:hypothetical protein
VSIQDQGRSGGRHKQILPPTFALAWPLALRSFAREGALSETSPVSRVLLAAVSKLTPRSQLGKATPEMPRRPRGRAATRPLGGAFRGGAKNKSAPALPSFARAGGEQACSGAQSLAILSLGSAQKGQCSMSQLVSVRSRFVRGHRVQRQATQVRCFAFWACPRSGYRPSQPVRYFKGRQVI